MKFRKKPVIIEAYQWWAHGDLNEVVAIPLSAAVKDGQRKKLGWLETPQGGHLVYPGDWVIIDQKGNMTTCNPISFAKQYESIEHRILPFPSQHGKSA